MKFFTSFLFVFLSLNVSAQLLDSLSLDTATIYTSMEEALKAPASVYKLKLKREKLDSIPVAQLSVFPNLQYLDLSKNNINEVSSTIAVLKNLQYLNLSNNNLITLPSQIADLKHLKTLIVNRNNIVMLPSRMGEMKNLVHLDLWSNELSDIPPEFASLRSLKYLDLREILFDDEKQKQIARMLPHTKVFFTPGCNCGK